MRPLSPRSFATNNRIKVVYAKSPPTASGGEAHAATFLNQRRIVLASALRRNAAERKRILTHELFHFVWRRLGNPARNAWRALLAGEFASHARGELGWSAEWRKKRVLHGHIQSGNRLWRDYSCEAFCDTAAWLYSGLRNHEEFTLARKWRNLRRAWFVEWIEASELRL